jgi:ankyrin repeat protein
MTITDFKILLCQSKYSEIISPQKNMTLVHVACSYGHLDILKALLESSTELLNQQDVEGWSPAHCAAAEGHVSVLLLLGKYGPLIGDNLWEFYSDSPIDLDLKTDDGESIEEVSMPEIQEQVLKIINGMSLSKR